MKSTRKPRSSKRRKPAPRKKWGEWDNEEVPKHGMKQLTPIEKAMR